MNEQNKNKLSSLSKEQLQALIKRRSNLGFSNKKSITHAIRNDNNKYKLSSSQERFWFLEQLNKNTPLYNNPVYAITEMKNPTDPVIMEKALSEIIENQEIFRTSFHFSKGDLYQKIHDNVPVKIDYEDICALGDDEIEKYMEETAKKEVSMLFNLEEPPLWRMRILKISPTKELFLFTPHHIISDGWSNSLFIKDLISSYNNHISVGYNVSEYSKYKYIDYVDWEQNWFDSKEYEKSINYWKTQFDPIPENIKLPMDNNRPPIITGNGKMVKGLIENDAKNIIQKFSKKNSVTDFHTLYSALCILLFKYSQQNEIVIGVPVANRNIKEFQDTLGLFLNTLPFKTKIDPESTFQEMVSSVKDQTNKNLTHQHTPLDKIISSLDLEQRLDITPLFQVLFVFQNIPSLYSFEDIKIDPFKVDIGRTKNDLNIWIEPLEDTYLITLFANTDIFSKDKIDRIIEHYKNIVIELLENPTIPIRDINFITQKELSLIFKSPIRDSKPESFISRFEANLTVCNNNIAIEFEDISITYKKLNSKANKLAQLLIEKNVNKKPIAILHNRCDSMIISLLAVIKSGVPYIPIDINQPSKRINYILEDSGTGIIITNETHKNRFNNDSLEIVYAESSLLESYKDENPLINTLPEDIIYIIYTSGTSGMPKGVLVSNSALVNYVDSITKRIGFKSNKRFATVSTISADLGNTMIFPALLTSGSILVVSDDNIFSPRAMTDCFNSLPPDYLKIVPSHLEALLLDNNNVLPKEAIILGGEEVSKTLISKIISKDNNIKIFNHYGPTETTIGVTTYEIKGDEDDIPIGKPLENYSVYILNEDRQVQPLGVEGEIYIGGNSVADGYLKNKKLTKESFINNPFTKVGKIYKTGDKGILREDGNIIFSGRNDRQIKYNGHRIELKEIESHLSHINGINKAVILIPNKKTNNKLWAIITVTESINEQFIKEQLLVQLPKHMLPNRIFILDKIPVTLNGKIDYELTNHMVLDVVNSEVHNNTPDNLSDVEKKLSKVFSQVLSIDNPDINKSFFDQGGTSISSIELLYLINNLFKTDLSVAFIFNYSSIKNISAKINQTFSFSNIVKIRDGSGNRSVFLVHPAGGNIFCYNQMANEFSEEYNIYGIQADLNENLEGNIKSISKSYLLDIYKLNLSGEFIFGGWSMGSLIAYEMAVYHKELRGVISKVFIIDQLSYQTNKNNLDVGDTERIVIFSKKVEHLIGDKLNIDYNMVSSLSDLERSMLFLKKFKQYNLVPKNIVLSDFTGFLDNMLFHNKISLTHTPSKYNGKVIIIRAESPMINDDGVYYDINPTDDLRWGEFAKSIIVITAPGNHASIIRSPNVEIMIHRLQKAL